MNEQQNKMVKINTDYITLGQLLKLERVINDGGEAKSFIQEHTILVNDENNKQRGKKLYPGMRVKIDDSLVFEITK
ncbi:MAG: S4 domain-containing protein YaaA [Bacilli bacterium]|jgi:ribosome-associated protein